MNQDILNKDVETILSEKIAYHKEQAKIHSKLAEETREKLRLISNKNAIPKSAYEMIASTVDLTLNSINSLVKDNTTNNFHQFIQLPLDLNFSVTAWKPRVEHVLRTMDLMFKTEDIVKAIDERYLENDEVRRQAIGVVSSSLFSLVEKNLVEKIPNNDSRGNLYKWRK